MRARMTQNKNYPKSEAFITIGDDGERVYELVIGDAVIVNPLDFEYRYEGDGIARLSMVVLVSWPDEKVQDVAK